MDIIRDDTAKRYRQIRKLLKGGELPHQTPAKCHLNGLYWAIAALLIGSMVLICLMAGSAHAEDIPRDKAVKAIIGEAEGEGYTGMYAIACAIRNRGNLHGVYGLRAPRVVKHLYSYVVLVRANKAWDDSAYGIDITHGSQYWGSLICDKKWINAMNKMGYIRMANIGNQAFFKKG